MDSKTMEELKTKLEEAISEEAADAEKYWRMAEMAPPEYACIISQIGDEEVIHHKHLSDILMDIEKNIPPHEDSIQES